MPADAAEGCLSVAVLSFSAHPKAGILPLSSLGIVAGIAQLVERSIRNAEVRSSNLRSGTISDWL